MSAPDTLEAARRRRLNFLGDAATRSPIPTPALADVPSESMTDGERATARPVIEAKVEEFAANLPPKARALIVSAALQNPALARQMRTGGISFSSTIVQNAVQAALASVEAGKINPATIAARSNDSGGPDGGTGGLGTNPCPRLTPLEAQFRASERARSSASYDSLQSSGNYTATSYASSDFARTGLNYAAFSDMRRQGFNAPQIMAAVRETKSLGIDTNRNAAPMARVQRDIPNAVPGLHQTRDNWSAVKALEDQQKQLQQAGNAAAAAALAHQIEEARKRAEEHDASEHARVLRERPERARDHQQLQGAIRRSTLGHEATPEVRNDASLPDRATRQNIQSGITPAASALKSEGQRIQAAAASEPEIQQTRTNLASRFGPAPDAAQPAPTPQPTRHAAAETPNPTPPTNPPVGAPIKTADATPARPQANTPRVG